MIVALLILIVFILLFGAAAVKGWLANVATAACGFAILAGLVIWVGSYFGDDGPIWLFCGGVAVLFIGSLYVRLTDPVREPLRATSLSKSDKAPVIVPEPPAVDRVWGWYADDIEARFSPASQARARDLHSAGNAHGLDRFCRDEITRLSGGRKRPDQAV